MSPEARRYRGCSTLERVIGRLKEGFGERHVRVHGHGKVMCHLIFDILALTVEQVMRLTPARDPAFGARYFPLQKVSGVG